MSLFSVGHCSEITGSKGIERVKTPHIQQHPVRTGLPKDTFVKSTTTATADVLNPQDDKIVAFNIDMSKKYGSPQLIAKVKDPLGDAVMGSMLLWKDKDGNNKAALLIDETEYRFTGRSRILGAHIDDKQIHITSFQPSGKTHNVDVAVYSEKTMKHNHLFTSIVERCNQKVCDAQFFKQLDRACGKE